MSETKTPPSRYCDLVMKGGVTSGVVYPLAAVMLSEEFVFKSIGGTSAGAIAAAATAVAESNREKGGFDRLRGLPAYLTQAAPDGSGSNLFAFFQPQSGTRRLFKVCAAGLGGGAWAWIRVMLQILASYCLPVLVGAVPGGTFLYLAWRHGSGPFLAACWIVGGLLLIVGIVMGAVCGVVRDVTGKLPGNFYGLCTGMTDAFRNVNGSPPEGKGKPLTYWLTEYFNSYYGRGPGERPVTFFDLWRTRTPNGDCAVRLEMMTTCLTHGRPYQLPFREDDDLRENSQFYFRRDEFDRLFPKSVVDWMVNHPRPISDSDSVRENILRANGFLPLPEPADLPLVVAVRMSLSFPVLLSAVPLHGIDWSRDRNGLNPERCWFSDGGVCSNFPIHFFDAPLPRWPTLSINLAEKPEGTPPSDLLHPEMPQSNSAGIQESWNLFEVDQSVDPASGRITTRQKSGLGKMASFGGAFISTMQNWTDTMQSRLPGYRDRIATVGLTPDEGGLNLNMPAQRIRELSARGEAAGEELIRRFGTPPGEPKMNWTNHRWLRMRSCLASMQGFLESFERACAHPQEGDARYESWVASVPPAKAPGYNWTEANQRDLALGVIRALRRTAESLASRTPLTDGSPRPRPELRPRPRA